MKTISASDPFIAAAGSWKDIDAKKLIDKVYKSRKDQEGGSLFKKRKTLKD